jgi:hypothetical protein
MISEFNNPSNVSTYVLAVVGRLSIYFASLISSIWANVNFSFGL